MNEREAIPSRSPPRRQAWNKGKLIGAKPPLRVSHVWSIRTKLQLEGRTRDLALFNLAIDSKLRGCDVVAVRVADVAPNGYTLDRATVRQKKTGRPVRFELTEQTRLAIDDYLRISRRKPGEYLFAGRGGDRHGLTTRHTPASSASGSRASASTRSSSGCIPCVVQGHADLPANR
jgi:integrase